MADDPIGVRSRLGYMPEHDCLPLDQTAADVVSTFGEAQRAPARAARQRASDILDLVGLDEVASGRSRGSPRGCASAPSSPRRWSAIPSWCSSTNRRRGSTRSVARMLALVARLGTFGISVLMATHLLDDVQQVCDHVVMIDAGRLVVSGATDSLLERTGVVTVDVGPRGDELVAALASRKLPAVGDEGLVEVTIEGDDDLDALRDVVAELGLPLYRLSARLTTLDEVFLHRAPGAWGEARSTPATVPFTCGYRPYEGVHPGGTGRRRSPCSRPGPGAWASADRGARRSPRSSSSGS